jgi:hypothetical protein
MFSSHKKGAKETKENEWKLMNQEGKKADGKYFCSIRDGRLLENIITSSPQVRL